MGPSAVICCYCCGCWWISQCGIHLIHSIRYSYRYFVTFHMKIITILNKRMANVRIIWCVCVCCLCCWCRCFCCWLFFCFCSLHFYFIVCECTLPVVVERCALHNGIHTLWLHTYRHISHIIIINRDHNNNNMISQSIYQVQPSANNIFCVWLCVCKCSVYLFSIAFAIIIILLRNGCYWVWLLLMLVRYL